AEEPLGLRQIQFELLVERRPRRNSCDAFLRRGHSRIELDDCAIFLERIGPALLPFALLRDGELRGDDAGALLLLDLSQRLWDLGSVRTHAARRFEGRTCTGVVGPGERLLA